MKIALASCEDLPGWEVDDHPFHSELLARNHTFTISPWDSAQTKWSEYDAVLIRTTWDYTQNASKFLDWAKQVSQETNLINPYPIVEWNISKRYLQNLNDLGVPIAPSFWLDKKIDIREILNSQSYSKWFLKPVVGACAESTLRFSAKEWQEAQVLVDSKLNASGMILQPYIESVETDGEWSVILFDGQFSHAVQKIPVPGDYRVQDDFGAKDFAVDAPEGLKELARTVWGALPFDEPPLVARIDALCWEGTWVLNELELIEPSLFFRHGPNASAMFIDAIEKRLNQNVTKYNN